MAGFGNVKKARTTIEKTAKAEKHTEYREMEHTSRRAYEYLAEERMDDL